MNLSKSIKFVHQVETDTGFSTAIIPAHLLEEWHKAAENLERDKRAAWRSFYIASGVVGLLLATVIGQRFGYHPQCGAQVVEQPGREVMELKPTEIRARHLEVYEL